jgi:YidC/Oxa1 family membrane protein insertase
MDRKTIIVLVVSFALLLLWPKLINRIFPPVPAPPRTNGVASATNQLPGTPATLRAAPTNAEAPAPAPDPAQPARPAPLVTPEAPERTEVIETPEARYTFTSHGGGLKLVELKRYPETVGSASRKLETKALASLNLRASVPVLALLGGEALQGDGLFELRKTANGVRAEKLLSNGLVVVKEFTLASNYLLHATTRLENRAAQPLALPAQEWEVGTATPMGPLDDGALLAVYWYNGTKNEIPAGEFSSSGFMCMPRTPPPFVARGQNDIFWAAAHNQFFALAVIPATNSPAAQIVVLKTNLPPPTAAELQAVPKARPHPFGLQAALRYPPAVLAPGDKLERQFHIYAGPKEYRLLAEIGGTFKNHLDLIMDYGGFFGFFAKILLLSMNGLHDLLRLPYGIVIIVITVLIKLLFWPLTQMSTRSMKRMQRLQPQMKALQEKYKDDPAKMNRKLMEFMKENKVSPMAGCLPMLLQLPVFFGFYKMIQSAIELRGARFLWASDLSKPDTIFEIPGLGWPVNPLPLLMGATMLWQARLTPASPGMDPMQQRIMKYMPVMFLFILYNFSAGLTLYWTVQNLLTIAQMKLTRSKDDAEAASKPAAAKLPAAKTPAPKAAPAVSAARKKK